MSSETDMETELEAMTSAAEFEDQLRKHLLPFVNSFIELHNKKRQEFKGHCYVSRIFHFA